MTATLPTRIVASAYFWRGARLWLLVRAAASAVLLLARADPLRLSPAATLAMVGLAIAVAFVDARRHREVVFLGNLGIGPGVFTLMVGTPAVIGEMAIHVAAAFVA